MQTSTDNMTTNASEEFSPLPFAGDATATAAPAHQFRGKPLFPYHEGIRLIYAPMIPAKADAGTWLLGLTFLLTDLQAGVDAHKAKKHTDEEAEDLAIEEVLIANGENPRAFYARTITRAGKLSRADLRAGIDLAETILRQHDAKDKPAPATAAPEASESLTPETEKPRAAGQRRGKVKAAQTGEAVASR